MVIFELQQTQTAMQAEASTMRTVMSMDNGELTIRLNFPEVVEKIAAGTELTEEEDLNLRIRMSRQLRYFENLHYQWQLGVLDEEIWQANLAGISGLHRNPGFLYTNPGWPDSFGASTFRKSFVDLVMSFRED